MEDENVKSKLSLEKVRKEDDDSTVDSIDLDSLPETSRPLLLWWFYSSKMILVILVIVFSYITLMSGFIDQYTYAGLTVAALGAYITGKAKKIKSEGKD